MRVDELASYIQSRVECGSLRNVKERSCPYRFWNESPLTPRERVYPTYSHVRRGTMGQRSSVTLT